MYSVTDFHIRICVYIYIYIYVMMYYKMYRQELRRKYEKRRAESWRGTHIGDRFQPRRKRRFKKWVRNMAIEAMTASIAAMFYACDYATKPNMVCASVLAAIRDGLDRLQQTLDEQRAQERLTELGALGAQGSLAEIVPASGLASSHGLGAARPDAAATLAAPKRQRPLSKLEQEAGRRLIRQAQAVNQAQVKGNCLMIMQMLTRREVIRSHVPWQLMMKHAMWMAFEYRRSLEGLAQRDAEGLVAVTMLEAQPVDSAERGFGSKADGSNSEIEADDKAENHKPAKQHIATAISNAM